MTNLNYRDLALTRCGVAMEEAVKGQLEMMEAEGMEVLDAASVIVTCTSSGLVSFAHLLFDKEDFLEAMSQVWDVVERENGDALRNIN
jgi:shikimate 5-dehydrogenase